MEETIIVPDWAEAFLTQPEQSENKEQLPKFKLELSPTDLYKVETVMFLDEGRQIKNAYGESILFKVHVGNVDMVWFVRNKMFSLLKPIAHQKPLTGKSAEVQRVGRTQKDTRWTIKFK